MGYFRLGVVLFGLMGAVAPSLAFAEKVALLFGGSGHENDPNNFFIADYRDMKAALEGRGYRVIVYFDSNPSLVPGAAGQATIGQIRAGIRSLNAVLKRGDQALIIGHAHGAPGETGKTGHGMLAADGMFPSVELQLAGLALTQKGVKTGVVDLSCYSGMTQPATAQPYCTMTLAAREYVSICSAAAITHSFTQALVAEVVKKEHQDLEDLFLASRNLDFTGINSPEISSFKTPINAIFNRVLVDTDPSSLEDKAKVGDFDQTPRPVQTLLVGPAFRELNLLKTGPAAALIEPLKDKVYATYAARMKLDQTIGNLVKKTSRKFEINPEVTEKVGFNYPKTTRDWILAINIYRLKGVLDFQAKYPTAFRLAALNLSADELNFYVELLAMRAEILEIYSDRMKNVTEIAAIPVQRKALLDASRAMFAAEHQVYDALFKAERADRTAAERKANPCASFPL